MTSCYRSKETRFIKSSAVILGVGLGILMASASAIAQDIDQEASLKFTQASFGCSGQSSDSHAGVYYSVLRYLGNYGMEECGLSPSRQR